MLLFVTIFDVVAADENSVYMSQFSSNSIRSKDNSELNEVFWYYNICAASSCVGSYAISGTINWSGVAWSAASGAICGSTGVVGKVGRWICKLF